MANAIRSLFARFDLFWMEERTCIRECENEKANSLCPFRSEIDRTKGKNLFCTFGFEPRATLCVLEFLKYQFPWSFSLSFVVKKNEKKDSVEQE